jgi:hypothetical protein
MESIQIGVGRALIRSYVDDWILSISDLTPLTRKLRRLCEEGKHARAQSELPPERVYPVEEPEMRLRLGMDL